MRLAQETFTQVVDYTSFMTHSSDTLAATIHGVRTSEAVWPPAGTLYFIDQQFRY